jgi:membrane associated rhomboid family serine protease
MTLVFLKAPSILNDPNQHEAPVRVRLTPDGELAKAYALTLTAMDMGALLASEEGGYAVYVTPEDELRATWELDQYDAENATGAAAGKQARTKPAIVVSFSTTALAYTAVLLFFFGAARRGSFGIDWAGEGAMVAHHVTSDLELWRTVTALTLHLDLGHIASNLAFGIIFVWLLAKETGPGIAWASTVLAGAAGNWLNALWQAPTHTSIGASTAVFAAVGLLAALRHRWRPPEFSLRYWAPLGGGIMLMAFLGFGDGNTDIGAHICGFFAGLAGGYWMSRKDKSWFGDEQRQVDGLKLAGFTLAGAWALALMF